MAEQCTGYEFYTKGNKALYECPICGKTGHSSSSRYVNLRREQDKCNIISLNSPTISENSKDNTKGRLKQAFSYWEYVEASEFILSIISEGYKIPFYSEPTPCNLKNNISAYNDQNLFPRNYLNYSNMEKLKNQLTSLLTLTHFQ